MEAELQGVFGCIGCHGTPRQAMATACLACHEVIREQLQGGMSGLHANINSERVEDCNGCHPEHRSHDAQLVSDSSFAAAGFGGSSGYQHQGLSFELAGKHLQLDCENCHELARAQQLEKGEQRFLGEVQQCAQCHEDPHAGKLPDCAACHGQEQEFQLAPEFLHSESFPLEGGHAGVLCQDCHARRSDHAFELLVESRVLGVPREVSNRECSVCHDNHHYPKFLTAVAAHLDQEASSTCGHCHDSHDQGFGGSRALMTPALHALTGFRIADAHAVLECAECHEGLGAISQQTTEGERRAAYAKVYPGRSQEECRACHKSPHVGQFETGTYADASCSVCHDNHSFRPAIFGVDAHEQTNFPLLGSHRVLDCQECHVPPDAPLANSSPIFSGTATRCEDCHEHPHAGQFEEGPFAGRDCLVCHNETAYKPSQFTLELHDRTLFPLTGAHRSVGCRNCHEAIDGDPDVRRLSGTPTECSRCHDNVHGDSFSQQNQPREVDGRSGCARCHAGAEAFTLVDSELFDHVEWTRFELRGKHAEAACNECHRAGDQGDATFGRQLSSKCSSCHHDPHAGQFAVRGEVDCSRCHVDDGTFEDLLFDHALHSRYTLDVDHEALDCSKCHRPVDLPGGGALVRYKPLGVECKDCHGDAVPLSADPRPQSGGVPGWRKKR